MEVKQGIEAKLPCRLIDEIDCTTFLTGIAWNNADLEVWYQKEGGSATQLALTVDNWTEIGDGNYDITASSTVLNTLKKFKYWVKYDPVASNSALPFSNTISVVKYLPADIGDDIKRVLGLSGEYKVLRNPTFDSEGRIITFELRIFGNETDANNDENPTATYEGTIEYDENKDKKVTLVRVT